LIATLLPGQSGTLPENWVGVWRLDVAKSTFGNSLFPGAPNGLTIISQTLHIEQIEKDIRLSGETVMTGAPGPAHDDIRLSLDGRPTAAGGMAFFFKRDNDSGFDVISTVSLRTGDIEEVSRFAYSPEGKTLTETKTQTQKPASPVDATKTSGPLTRSSKFILVFSRLN
jgi:hypothetical protein